MAGHKLIVASDGSKKETGGTYGWILETETGDLLAEGMGPVHGTINTLTSHQAELYGITSMIIYILQICTYYIISTTRVKLRAYYNNVKCVKKVNQALKPLRGTARYITADYDVESLLRHAIASIQSDIIPMWIKGYQEDYASIDELSHPAQMNVAADGLSEFAYKACVPSQENHPPFPTTSISLTIAGRRITSNMTQQIEDPIHLTPIQKYRNAKYSWNSNIWETIDWYSFEIAIKQQQPGLKQFIHRFTCEWLPVGSRTKFYHNNNNAKCGSCQSEHDESCIHVFQCPNPHRREQLLKQILHLMSTLRKKHTYRPIVQIIQTNLVKWSKGEPFENITTPLNPTKYNHMLQEAVEEQNAIGWEHLLKGWMSKQWAQAQDEYYKDRSKHDKKIN